MTWMFVGDIARVVLTNLTESYITNQTRRSIVTHTAFKCFLFANSEQRREACSVEKHRAKGQAKDAVLFPRTYRNSSSWSVSGIC